MAHDQKRRGNTGSSQKPTPGMQTSSQRGQNQAVVPRGSRAVARHGPEQSGEKILAPKGYTMRQIQPAKNYDVVSFARAMNDDFGPKVKKLFDPEREAALAAQETGVYIGWRCPEFKWDCQRVGRSSKCFCGHLLAEHGKYDGQSVRVPCREGGCRCKAFAWVPSRPEDVGEFWLQKRRDFDPATWRMKCRCKHTHEEHDVGGQHRCFQCGCGIFTSSSVCAACDRHWEEHETFFESERDRKEKGLPYGEDYLPFAEIPSLRNMVLTGEDDGDMSYMRLQERQLKPAASNARALPSAQNPHTHALEVDEEGEAVVPFRDSQRAPNASVDAHYGQGRHMEHSRGEQDYRSRVERGPAGTSRGQHHTDRGQEYSRNHGNYHYGDPQHQGRPGRGGFRPTYD